MYGVLILYKLCIGKTTSMYQYTIHMYSTSTSTVHCTVQSVNLLLFLGSVQFYLGGLAHCTVQSVYLFFDQLNFIGGGGA